jgi:hypothetical protein
MCGAVIAFAPVKGRLTMQIESYFLFVRVEQLMMMDTTSEHICHKCECQVV